MPLPSSLKLALALIAVATYITLMYLSASAPDAAARTVVLTVLAWQGFAVGLLWVNGKRWQALAVALPAPLLFVFYDDLKQFEWLCLIPNALVHASLLGFFARTLLPGRTALITQLATTVHGSIPPPIQQYTRSLTYVWSGFFALSIVAAFGLYFFVSFAAWSLFSNVYALPIMVGLFIGEYLYRRWRFPWFEHVSIAAGIKAFAALSQPQAEPSPKIPVE